MGGRSNAQGLGDCVRWHSVLDVVLVHQNQERNAGDAGLGHELVQFLTDTRRAQRPLAVQNGERACGYLLGDGKQALIRGVDNKTAVERWPEARRQAALVWSRLHDAGHAAAVALPHAAELDLQFKAVKRQRGPRQAHAREPVRQGPRS